MWCHSLLSRMSKPTYNLHFTLTFLVAVYVMEKKNILAYFCDFSLKAECLFSLSWEEEELHNNVTSLVSFIVH